MKQRRPLARWQFIALLLILVLLLAGCGNYRHGVAWPSLDLVTIDEKPLVLVTYNAQVDIIDPYQGGQRYALPQSGTGEQALWTISGATYANNQFYASPFTSSAANGETLVFPTYNHRLLEFYLENAQPVNTAGIALTDAEGETAEVLADVVADENLLYVGYRQHDLVALDRETYEEVWRFETSAGIWSAPVLHEGVLYVPTINHFLHAVDATTGVEIWSLNLEGSISSTPLLYNNFLYVGSFSHKLFQINLDGEIVNSYQGNNWIWSTPVVADDILYYSDLGGYVYALNADDLSEVWVQRPAQRGIRPAPLVTEDFIIVASRDGHVYWLTPETGVTVQQAEFRDKVEILSDILYLPADEANDRPPLMLVASADTGKLVMAFNLETFSPQWVYNR